MRQDRAARPKMGDFDTFLASYIRHLRAVNYSPRTDEVYSDAVGLLAWATLGWDEYLSGGRGEGRRDPVPLSPHHVVVRYPPAHR